MSWLFFLAIHFLGCNTLWRQSRFRLAWENSRHFATIPLVSPRNDVYETSTEIPYWWRYTTQIWVVLLIGWSKFHRRHDRSEALARSWHWRVISMEFLRSLLRRHFAGKPLVASRNVVCFLRLDLDEPKTAYILQHYERFPHEMASEERAQKFHTDNLSLPRSG